jgi:hypothetical protein
VLKKKREGERGCFELTLVVEFGAVVGSFRAEVVDLVCVLVATVQKVNDL